MKGQATRARVETGVLMAVISIGVVGTSALSATAGEEEKAKTRDATLTGKITDLHSYMTGQSSDGGDVSLVRKRFRGGVPMILQTDDGPVILGQGDKRPGAVIMRHVLQQVQVSGKLYEKRGLQYLDIEVASVKAVAAEDEGDDEDEEVEQEHEADEEEEGETEWEESEGD
ncbi:MAG: hypothetical protein ACYTFA_01925 [Planctomycetota bacterium]|jgi:hypothetical protein